MKKKKVFPTILRWCFSGFCFTAFLAFGFHISSFILLLAGFIMMPLFFVQNILDKLKIKKGIAIAISAVLFCTGVAMSPDIDSGSTDSQATKVESVSKDDTKEEKDEKDSKEKTDEKDEKDDKKEDESSATGSSNTTVEPTGTGTYTPIQVSEVAPYSGNAYIAINDNIPNFSAAELTTVGYEKYSSLDNLGRCGSAIASCGKEIMPKAGEERGSISSIKPSGWIQAKYDGISGGYLWNRCHLIGWQLSAENANRQNLITGTRYMNINGMLTFENMVADYIKETGNHVAYRITPIYSGNNLVCSGVQMEAYSIEDNGDGICFNVYCYNVQPGIVIDYATGNSRSENASSGTQNSTSSNNTPTPTPNPSGNQQNTNNNSNSNTGNNVTVPEPEQGNNLVWVPVNGGKKYHTKSSCSGMKDPIQVTEDTAISNGYTPCGRCY